MTANIQAAASKFEDRIRALLHVRVENIDQNVLELKTGVEEIDNKLAAGFKEGWKLMSSLEDTLNGIAKDFECEWSRIETAMLMAMLTDNLLGQYEKFQLRLEERVTQAIQQRSESIGTATLFLPPPIQHIVTAKQVLDVLSDPKAGPTFANMISEDRDLVSFFGQAMDQTRQGRIGSIMKDPQFQHWVRSASSETLVVNCFERDLFAQETVSPLSYMCQLLSQTVARLQFATPLNFFCGLHCESEKGAGGAAIIRSLVSQVLVAYGDSINLDFLEYAALEEIRKGDIQILCGLFEGLLERIGPGALFCIIDGVAWYESESRKRDMDLVMGFLSSLVDGVQACQNGFVFKLLITSPVASHRSKVWFPAAIELRVPDELHSGGHGFDELQLLQAF